MEVDTENEPVGVDGGLLFLRAAARPAVSTAHLSHVAVTVPGARITADAGVVRGHGTRADPGGDALSATVSGLVERVNKLVAVRPLRARYAAEVGDVVVGRVVEIGGKRWRMDLNSRGDAYLLLSAVNLPGGVQRRRNQQDELNMRAFFREGDLVSAEVQELRGDGGVALHTRSMRYGKLERGQFVAAQAALVKRAKKHFHVLPCGVHIILGNNGYVFLSVLAPGSEDVAEGPDSAALQRVEPSPEQRRTIARVRNCIVALDLEFVAISPATITDVYQTSVEREVPLADMLRPDVVRAICNGARELRDAA
jgi:exosome complex component RRP4